MAATFPAVPYARGLLLQSNAPQARAYLGIGAAGVGFISAGTESDAGGIVFANSNGVTFGMSNSTVTASVAAGGGLTAINVSAGSTSNNLSAFTFANSNGVSFGLNGSVISATVATNYQSQGAYLTTAQPPGAYLTTAMASNQGSDFVAATAAFFGTNASGTIASNAISVSVAPPSAASINLSAGTTSNNLTAFTLSNSNNVSFGLNGSVVTASATVASTQASINLSAGTTSNISSQFSFANSNGVTFGLDNGTITASVAAAAGLTNLVVAAGASTNSVSQLVFSNSNNVTFGLNGSTITASISAATQAGNLGSFFANALPYVTNLTANAYSSRTSNIHVFQLPYDCSFGFIRFLNTMSVSNVGTYSTSNAATHYTASQVFTTNVVFYQLGSSNSSLSLTSVTSCSAGMTISYDVSQSASSQTYQTFITYPVSGTYSSITSIASRTTSNMQLQTASMVAFTANRFVDLPASFSLKAGAYWLAFGVNSTSNTQGVSNPIAASLDWKIMGVANSNLQVQGLGGAVGGEEIQFAVGSFTSAAVVTVTGIPIANISSVGPHFFPYWQGINVQA